MERAAQAEQLKLTSKAVAGKRTLMVEGTAAVHERVKLMVRELTEHGESPMLNKALRMVPEPEVKIEDGMSDLEGVVKDTSIPGVVSAPPVLKKQKEEPEVAKKEELNDEPVDLTVDLTVSVPAAKP